MTPDLCVPVLGNSACLGPPTLVSVVRGPGLRQVPLKAAFQDSTACLHSSHHHTAVVVYSSTNLDPVPHGFLWHRKFSFPSPSSKATSSLLQPLPLAFPVSQMDQLSSLPSQPSQLPLISRLSFKPQGFPGRRKERFLGIAPHSELSARRLLSLSELRREQSLPLSISSLPLPSSLPPFCLPFLLSSVSPLLIPSLSSHSVLSFFLPLLDLIPMGFRSLVPTLDTTKLRLGEVPSDPKSQG